MKFFLSVVYSAALILTSAASGDFESVVARKGVTSFLEVKRIQDPDISAAEQALAVLLNHGEVMCIFPDERKLSGLYEFSSREKDAYVASSLTNSADVIAVSNALRRISARDIPDSCARAMTRLGVESMLAEKYGESRNGLEFVNGTETVSGVGTVEVKVARKLPLTQGLREGMTLPTIIPLGSDDAFAVLRRGHEIIASTDNGTLSAFLCESSDGVTLDLTINEKIFTEIGRGLELVVYLNRKGVSTIRLVAI